MKTTKMVKAKTRRVLTDEEIANIKKAEGNSGGKPLMVGERMIITRDTSIVVAYQINEKRAAREYLEALAQLPNNYTRRLETKKQMLRWAKQGVNATDIVDRLEALVTDNDESGARQEYMKALMELPTGYTEERNAKKMMLEWARQGIKAIDIVDRIETLVDEEIAIKEEHKRLTQEYMDDKEYDSTIITNEDTYISRRTNGWK